MKNQQEQIRNYRRRCSEYNALIRNDIKEKEQKKQQIDRKLEDLEKCEMEKNLKQMQAVLKKETENETERKLDRQKADFLSKLNQQQMHNRNFLELS